MSKWALAAMILFAGSVTAPAQNLDGWAQKLFADKGKIVTSYDFGTVPFGARLHHSFEMTNIYAVPLTVHLRTSSDCVKATASKQVIEPNKKGTIEIDMDGRRFKGAKSVNVFVMVRYEDEKQAFNSTAQLKVSATTP